MGEIEATEDQDHPVVPFSVRLVDFYVNNMVSEHT